MAENKHFRASSTLFPGTTYEFDRHGRVRSITDKSQVCHTEYYASVTKFGHVGKYHTALKIIATVAENSESAKRKIISNARVKSENESPIMAMAKISLFEYRLINFINDNDTFFTERIVRSSNLALSQRYLSSSLAERALNGLSYKEDSNFHIRDARDFDETSILQRAYAPYIEYSNGDSGYTRVIENAPPLEGKILYDYFKQQMINLTEREDIHPRDKFHYLLIYLKILPKYKKFIQADENPFLVYVEKLEPGNTKHVIESPFIINTGKTSHRIYSRRDPRTTQYAVTYIDSNGKEFPILCPDHSVSDILNNPPKRDVDSYISDRIERREFLDQSDRQILTERVYDLLINKRVDVSDLDDRLKRSVRDLARHYVECSITPNEKRIEQAEYSKYITGEFLGKEFYDKGPKQSIEISASEYDEYLKKTREKNMAKFARFTPPTAKKNNTTTTDSEPGCE